MIKIIPSLASASQLNLQGQIDRLGSQDRIHLDIEDGNFLPNITFGMKTIRAVAGYTDRILDAHLLVNNPGLFIGDLLELGIREIAFHIEATPYPGEHLTRIREAGGRAGLAFNCMAPVDLALPYQEDLDYLILMTSEPDGRGQLFNPQMLHKIRRARSLFPPRVSIMVDGGITAETLPQVVQAGADTVVMGRAIWSAPDPEQRWKDLLNMAEGRG